MKPMCRPYGKCHVSSPRGSTTGIQGDGVMKIKCPNCKERYLAIVLECPGCGQATPDGAVNPFKTDSGHRWPGEGPAIQELRRSGAPSWNDARAQLAALRAKVPEALALAVCLAAEHDLAAGAMPYPTMIWEAIA